MFINDGPIRRESLGYMQRVYVIHRYLGRHVGIDGTQGVRGGINHHLTVERSIERITSAEMNDRIVLQIIAIIEISVRSQRRKKSMPHEGNTMLVEIEVSFVA